jgi:acyl-CoA thioester hydrolase
MSTAANPANDQPLLGEYPVVVRLPVQWGEMDAYGHVNNAVFFRYFETARIAYLERCGFVESYDTDKVGAILHSTSCRYRRPLHYPDTVLVGARAREVQPDRFTMEYRMVSLTEQEVAAEGTGVIVSFDYVARRKTTLPQHVRQLIGELEDTISRGP